MNPDPSSDTATPGCLRSHPEGVVIAVRAQPGARKRGFQGMVGDEAKIAVQAPPEDGKANQALVVEIAQLFDVRENSVELLQGRSSRQKRFLIRGVDLPEASLRWRSKTSAQEGAIKPSRNERERK